MTQPQPLPPLETLQAAFSYDPETGALTWRVTLQNRAPAGSPAGCPNGRGYLRVKLNGLNLKAHRVAWYLHHGADPGLFLVDHIDRNRSNNRICNLRLVDHKGNRANSSQPTRPVQITYPDGRGKITCDSVVTAARLLGRDPRRLVKPLKTGRPLAWPIPGSPGLYTSSGIRVSYLPPA